MKDCIVDMRGVDLTLSVDGASPQEVVAKAEAILARLEELTCDGDTDGK